MTDSTLPHGFEASSMSTTAYIYNPLSYSEYYKMTDSFGNVTQTLYSATYTDQANPGNKYRDMATYQLPLTIGQNLTTYLNLDSYSAITYDLQSGYALRQMDFRTHALYISSTGYFSQFFSKIQGTTGEILSLYNMTSMVDANSFVSAIYPSNGTIIYENGVKDSTDTKKSVQLDAVLPTCGIALIGMTAACFFIARYYKEAGENSNDTQDVAMDNSGFRNLNNKDSVGTPATGDEDKGAGPEIN